MRKGTGLLAGRDGWLFWIGTNSQNLQLYRGSFETKYRLWRWTRLIVDRAERCRRAGTRYLQLIVPDKLSIYDNKLVSREVDPNLSFGLRLGGKVAAAGWPDTCIDLFSPLRSERDERQLYLRTDTHFTPAGYMVAYRAICAATGAEPARQVLAGRFSSESCETDLGSKLHPPEREVCEVYQFDRQARRVDANALVEHREEQLRHVPGIQAGSRIVLRNDLPEADPRRIVLFGDSYTFHETGLGAMLAETFREVHLVWSSALDLDYVSRVRPDLLIHEIAERFVRRMPRDGVSIDAFAAERLAAARAQIKAGAL